jgi:3-methylcrotonyl-CoA carboxylase alpha subunit/acetyl-CoA/propionyl-CoA carboxylase biotin carboxyl carrier protein
MLGKVITHGPTREAARRALVAALDDTAVLGLTTNLGFLRRLVDSDVFRDAGIDTAWLDREPGAFPAEPPDTALVLAAWALAATPVGQDRRHPFGVADGWRVAGPPAPVVLELDSAGTRHVLHVDLAAGSVVEGERRWEVSPLPSSPGHVRLEVDGVLHESDVEVGPHGVAVAHHGDTLVFAVPDAFGPTGAAAAADGVLTAPMPGVVLAVNVAAGESVAEGTVLGVLEAMKMELALKAPYDGVVTLVGAAVGDRVDLGQALFEVEEPGA